MRPWWILAGASGALFMLMLDSTAIALALPSIRIDLGASSSGIQWAQNVYLLVLAALVVTVGRLGDLLGRRAVLVAGLTVFAIGSIVCATAGSIALLVAGRAIQGAGAAAMLALSPALAAPALAKAGRAWAIGIWAAVSGIALAIGPLVGGVVVEVAGWRWLFWLNLPLAAISLVLVATAVSESRDKGAGRHIDLGGLVTSSAGLTLVVLALVQGTAWGWASIDTLGSLAGGVALLGAFVVVEARARAPLVDLAPFRSGRHLGAGAAAFALVGSYWTVMFLLPQYLDLGLRFSAARAGALMLPVTVPMAFLAPLAVRAAAHVGARAVMSAGMACATLGILSLTRLDGSSNYWDVAPGLILFGLALGLVYAPLSAAAPGALTMARCSAGALVLAAAGAVFQQAQADDRAAGASFEGAFAAGVADACWLLAAVLAIGTLLTWLLVRSADEAHEPHHRRFHL